MPRSDPALNQELLGKGRSSGVSFAYLICGYKGH
jgi:hypothetical protein